MYFICNINHTRNEKRMRGWVACLMITIVFGDMKGNSPTPHLRLLRENPTKLLSKIPVIPAIPRYPSGYRDARKKAWNPLKNWGRVLFLR
jgi:hypothetical protein